MGSVIEAIECPRCNQEAYMDFYYKTGEEYIFCDNCGYSRSVEIINRDKNLDELNESDYSVKENKEPYGAFRAQINGIVTFQIGTLSTEEDYKEFVKCIQDDSEIGYAHVSRFVDGTILKEILVDKGPTFDGAGFTSDDNLPF